MMLRFVCTSCEVETRAAKRPEICTVCGGDFQRQRLGRRKRRRRKQGSRFAIGSVAAALLLFTVTPLLGSPCCGFDPDFGFPTHVEEDGEFLVCEYQQTTCSDTEPRTCESSTKIEAWRKDVCPPGLVAVPTVSEWGLILLAVLLGAVGVVRMRAGHA